MKENPWPLYDALDAMALSVLASADDGTSEAREAHLKASMSAPEAFPPAPLADALNLILGHIGNMANGAEVVS